MVSVASLSALVVQAPRSHSVDAPTAGKGAAASEGGGITGTKSLGVRELTYRMAFLASSVVVRARQPPLLALPLCWQISLSSFPMAQFSAHWDTFAAWQ